MFILTLLGMENIDTNLLRLSAFLPLRLLFPLFLFRFTLFMFPGSLVVF